MNNINTIPIRLDIEVLGPDKEYFLINEHDVIVANPDGTIINKNNRKLKLGWSVTEKIGIGCINPRGITTARKNK